MGVVLNGKGLEAALPDMAASRIIAVVRRIWLVNRHCIHRLRSPSLLDQRSLWKWLILRQKPVSRMGTLLLAPESAQQMLRKPLRCEKHCSVHCIDSGHGKQSHRARTWKLEALSHYHLNQPFLKSRMSPFLLQSLTKRVDAGRTRPRPKKRNIRTHGSIWENKTPVTDTHVTESDDWEALKAD